MTNVNQRTVLFDAHVRLGAKIVPFAGWEMPVQYSSIMGGGVIAEHIATRTAAGLFDVSHMGELWVTGPEALKLIDSLTCNRVTAIADGRAQYNAIINPAGGVVDDIIVYRFGPERFLICVNASNASKDFDWIKSHNIFNAQVVNASAEYGQIAMQGPRALEILSALTNKIPQRSFAFTEDTIGDCGAVIIARTGYTGEDGVEIFTQAAKTEALWERLLETGKSHGLVPCGLGARDSLRLEACLPLHGHELSDDISAYESGLGWIIKLDKGEFTGKAALEKSALANQKKLVGFFVTDAGIARHGDLVFDAQGEKIGIVTSGTKTPTINKALGLALVDTKFTQLSSKVFIDVRGRKLQAEVEATPFYRRAK